MNVIYITGTSRGIGKALAEEGLKKEDNLIIGIGRNQTIEHERYNHLFIDLSDIEEVKAFELPGMDEVESVALINNAGVLGEIAPLGRITDDSIEQIFNVNIIALSILMNKFLGAFEDFEGVKTIINISSGAAKNPYDGWSGYCSTKAAVDMISRVAAQEQELHYEHPTKIYAVAPGVVSTKMQEQIRSVNPSDFSRKQKFIDLFEQDQLLDPKESAAKIFRIFEQQNRLTDVVLSVSDL